MSNVYYIGLNANNAICNESFFSGSITIYPTNEKGNKYYSNTLLKDTKSDSFFKSYKKFIYEEALKIQKSNSLSKFMFFNEKVKELCSDMKNINFIKGNDSSLIKKLNDKFYVREFIKNDVPILDYYYTKELDYNFLTQKFNCSDFVIQTSSGSGGSTTILVSSESDLEGIKDKAELYSVSQYQKHLPLNITLIIADDSTIYLPISVQLIKPTDRKFKYVGADFEFAKNLDLKIRKSILEYSSIISKKVKDIGYRGVLGIDYMLTSEGKVFFIEINPRFQSSSFFINLELEKKFNTNIAELNYLALTNYKIPNINLESINGSFVNANINQQILNNNKSNNIYNGYFKDNINSYYRKLYDYSIVNLDNFEKI